MNTDWTNSEAAKTKFALSELHYTDDQFIKYFCNSPLKRTPEINRGYWARFTAISHAIESFCEKEGENAQIVNIGSGFDTLYWRLVRQNVKFARIVDIDTNQVVCDKIHLINKSPQLSELLDGVEYSNNWLHSKRYHLMTCDATKFKRLIDLLKNSCEVDGSKPVLFVFECVLLYWTHDETNSLFFALNKSFSCVNVVIFDCVNMNDTFARVMIQSLSERDTPLLGAESCVTLEHWKQRCESSGLKHIALWDMKTVFYTLLPQQDIDKIEKIEFLDEKELLTQLLSHYCLVIASNYNDVFW